MERASFSKLEGETVVDHVSSPSLGLSRQRCAWRWVLVGFGGRPTVTEGDGEGVEYSLPAHRPSAACASGAHVAGDKVQTFDRGLVGWGMAAGADRSPVAGVERFDGYLEPVSGCPVRR